MLFFSLEELLIASTIFSSELARLDRRRKHFLPCKINHLLPQRFSMCFPQLSTLFNVFFTQIRSDTSLSPHYFSSLFHENYYVNLLFLFTLNWYGKWNKYAHYNQCCFPYLYHHELHQRFFYQTLIISFPPPPHLLKLSWEKCVIRDLPGT